MRSLNAFAAGLSVCALGIMATPVRAGAQDVAPSIARAQSILTEMERVIDGILARQTARSATVEHSPESAAAGGWFRLFDGKSLGGWTQTDFYGTGAVHVHTSFRGGPPAVVIDAGSQLSGINWTGAAPKTNYEIMLDFIKIKGDDFACGLTFPVADSHATLVLGGWGGMVIGVSSIDGADASENETTRSAEFPAGRWYRVRVRVTPDKLQSWLDEKQIVDLALGGRRIGLRPGPISRSRPLGIATYQTSAAFRDIKLRRLGQGEPTQRP